MNADGLVADEQVDCAVEHAQRVAEGVNHEIHRNTWRYSVVIEQQRKALAERRERLLTTDVAALHAAWTSSPRRPRRSTRTCCPGRPGRSRSTTSTGCWAEHLAELAEVREGVHLRALGRLDPLDEFHRAAVPAFNALVPEIEDAHRRRRSRRPSSTDDWQPDEAELVRPSATWTYLVHDNPFGSELDRLISAVSRRLGGRGRG